MTRRPTLPGASELFRSTVASQPAVTSHSVAHQSVAHQPVAHQSVISQSVTSQSGAASGEPEVVLTARTALPPRTEPAANGVGPDVVGPKVVGPKVVGPKVVGADVVGADDPAADSGRRGSGREKHSTKFTVYASDEELLALEQAKLVLRGSHGLVVDRGRVVREAIAIVLDDLEGRGDDSLLVRRLRER
ncbi:hypothetical protein Amir_5428 [Actinosynnema mirum DSM 43827]|uniref:Cobyrinic acid ac-diamide synthase n=1 Tax=Actinosynnema mirum (strain ATCC 29888 / DSM 43827 / JCM 3225 / NBRC 14064 / NCIMB 13271 / NRRL B-12336 / IMRU 3971 / 101) TaxID=446462 RepID=C6WA58_ACTMD|nr:hypothetical protein Amir_5428 [Actinosynnema mirum DSM 43827]